MFDQQYRELARKNLPGSEVRLSLLNNPCALPEFFYKAVDFNTCGERAAVAFNETSTTLATFSTAICANGQCLFFI
jgi:hypothetical protein